METKKRIRGLLFWPFFMALFLALWAISLVVMEIRNIGYWMVIFGEKMIGGPSETPTYRSLWEYSGVAEMFRILKTLITNNE